MFLLSWLGVDIIPLTSSGFKPAAVCQRRPHNKVLLPALEDTNGEEQKACSMPFKTSELSSFTFVGRKWYF